LQQNRIVKIAWHFDRFRGFCVAKASSLRTNFGKDAKRRANSSGEGVALRHRAVFENRVVNIAELLAVINPLGFASGSRLPRSSTWSAPTWRLERGRA